MELGMSNWGFWGLLAVAMACGLGTGLMVSWFRAWLSPREEPKPIDCGCDKPVAQCTRAANCRFGFCSTARENTKEFS